MSVQFFCGCGKAFTMPEARAGQRVRCPGCGAQLLLHGDPPVAILVGRPEKKPRRTDAPLPARVAPSAPPLSPRGKGWLVGTVVVALGVLASAGYVGYRLAFRDKPSAEVPPEQLAREPSPPNLKVAGLATPAWRTETAGDQSSSYRQWNVSVDLKNDTGFDVQLGHDLFLIESSADGSAFEGAALFRSRTPEPKLSVLSLLDAEADILDGYGLANYEITYRNGQVGYRKGNNVALSPPPHGTEALPPASGFGASRLGKGETRSLLATPEQGSVLNDELRQSMRVVLPEIRLLTSAGEERYRLIAHWVLPAEDGKAQDSSRHEWVRIDRANLTRLVEDAEADPATRVLAANWLAELDPAAARAALVRATPKLRQAKLLVSYLRLLTRLREPGLEAEALNLCKDPATPPDVRRLAAEYLGTLRYEPALQVLIAAAGDKDETVARGAITALGANGSPAAQEALFAVLEDQPQSPRPLLVARNLLRSRQPEVVRRLEALAGKGNSLALYALTENAPPQSFAFFADLAEKEPEGIRRELALRGLRLCGGEKAGPVLAPLLHKDEPPAGNPLQTSALVRELIALNSPRLVPELSVLAAKGNLRALQVLAGYRQEAALAPLQERAQRASGPARLIALNGLATHWPRQSVNSFKAALESNDPDLLAVAARGLAASNDPAVVPLLLAALKTPDARVRGNVVASLVTLPADRYAGQWLDALLATEDDQVAVTLVDALVKAEWKDRTALPRLGTRLKASKGDLCYQLIRVLRHLGDNSMGPANYFEYQKEPEVWNQTWTEWAAKNK